MKLEVGMYVRKKNGRIGKIIEVHEIYNNHFEYLLDIKNSNFDVRCEEKHIYKTSHNIIDLIGVGDILKINNEKYEVIYDESYEKLGILIPSRKELSIRHSALEYVFKKYNVSIVTKEQFESMSYKVGDNK